MTQAVDLKQFGDDIDAIYDQNAEAARLRDLMGEAYVAILRAVNVVIGQAFSGLVNIRLDDPTVRRMLVEAGQRIVRIDEETRKQIAEMLMRGQEAGYSSWQIAHGVPADDFPGIDGLFKETWRSRAETVARTELQHAQLVSAIDRYHATGLVSTVQLVDGEDDEPCRSRNGRVVPIDRVPGLAHPNCTLGLIPIVNTEAA